MYVIWIGWSASPIPVQVEAGLKLLSWTRTIHLTLRSTKRWTVQLLIIVADCLHFSRNIYWALERVRIHVQREFHEYDQKIEL